MIAISINALAAELKIKNIDYIIEKYSDRLIIQDDLVGRCTLDLSNRGLEDVKGISRLSVKDRNGGCKLLSQFQNLQLDLSNNALKQLPAEIGELTTLDILDLSNNRLSQLPAEI